MPFLPSGLGTNGFCDLFVEQFDSLTVSWKGGAARIGRGIRSGTGIRRSDRSGSVRFWSLDDDGSRAVRFALGDVLGSDIDIPPGPPRQIEQPPAGASGMIPLAEAFTEGWDPDLGVVLEYIEEVAAGLEVATARSGRAVEVAAKAQLYRQAIHHETPDREVEDLRTGVRIELRATREGRTLLTRQIGDLSPAALRARRPPQSLAAELDRATRERVESGSLARPDGDMPVVLAAGGCGPFLHEIGHLFEDDSSAAGRRPFEPGQKVARAGVTILDDPAACAGRGAYRFDDEGTPASRSLLVEDGVVAGGLGSARPDGRPATGHARRGSYRDLPAPRMACTLLLAGGDQPEAILEDTRRGLFVRTLGTASIEPGSGKMVLIASEGFLIEGGRCTRPIAETLLLGTASEWMGTIDAIGFDAEFDHGSGNCVKLDQQIPVTVGLPTVRIGLARVLAP